MDRPPAWNFQEGVDGKLKSNLQWPNSMQCQKTWNAGGPCVELADSGGARARLRWLPW